MLLGPFIGGSPAAEGTSCDSTETLPDLMLQRTAALTHYERNKAGWEASAKSVHWKCKDPPVFATNPKINVFTEDSREDE